MALVRTVVRGEHTYYYLVQTYRWGGSVHRKEKYLGPTLPRDLKDLQEGLEREVWELTWFREFESIRDGYAAHLRSLPEDALEKEQEQFVVEFTYDTNRIEGSTLTFRETADLLTDGVSPRSKPMRDIREAQLHAGLLRRLMAHPEPIDTDHLLAWHKYVFSETKPTIAGRIRDFDVRIGRSRHVPPPALEVRPMLLELLRRTRRGFKVTNPVERAATFHFEFESVHPFGDGNGRIGRLAMNMLLRRDGFPMVNIQYGKRSGYYHALERASLTSHPRSFLLWFFRRYKRDHTHWAAHSRGGVGA
jgi:Fic family protein